MLIVVANTRRGPAAGQIAHHHGIGVELDQTVPVLFGEFMQSQPRIPK